MRFRQLRGSVRLCNCVADCSHSRIKGRRSYPQSISKTLFCHHPTPAFDLFLGQPPPPAPLRRGKLTRRRSKFRRAGLLQQRVQDKVLDATRTVPAPWGCASRWEAPLRPALGHVLSRAVGVEGKSGRQLQTCSFLPG